MQKHIVNYLRLVGFSLAAVAISACARLFPPSAAAMAAEPRFADAPDPAVAVPDFYDAQDEDDRTAALQARLDVVDSEIANLRKVFDVLGPLPDHADLFIPVALSEIDGSNDDIAHRYSPVARGTEADIARFQRIELASYPARAEAEARWSALVASGGLTRCRPGYEGIDAGVSLGDLSDDDTLNALCVELSALAGPARVAAPIRGSW
jgi:hypothetical protein